LCQCARRNADKTFHRTMNRLKSGPQVQSLRIPWVSVVRQPQSTLLGLFADADSLLA
jgi:hypothetical protein